MKHEQLKKLVTSALLVAVIIVLSGFYIPVGASKCFPIQHMVNILSAILLGPGWGVAIAFVASLIRNLMGNRQAALFAYVLPFFISTAGGTLLAAILVSILDRTKALQYMHR